jgi:hypothetical protein
MNAAVMFENEILPGGETIKVARFKPKPSVQVDYERDPRAMNRMDPDTKLVHARLERWGRWAKDHGIQGYPKQSLTERAAQYGKLGIPQESNVRAEPVMPDDIAQVDIAICRLWGIGQRCVKRYYTKWEPMDVMAKEEGISESHMKEVLRRSRHLIGMWLEEAEKV